MADLLECLVQVRALAGTPARLAALLAGHGEAAWRHRDVNDGASPLERLVALAEGELLFAAALRLTLAVAEPFLPSFADLTFARRSGAANWSAAEALERFRDRRADNVEFLASCNAAELARTGRHPERGATSVADLVAIMLASDTESVGAIRTALAAAVRNCEGG